MISIAIGTSNAAFSGSECLEVSRILRKLSEALDTSERDLESFNGRPIHDLNGNFVGLIAAYTEEER